MGTGQQGAWALDMHWHSGANECRGSVWQMQEDKDSGAMVEPLHARREDREHIDYAWGMQEDKAHASCMRCADIPAGSNNPGRRGEASKEYDFHKGK
jgi:hypothetical protein